MESPYLVKCPKCRVSHYTEVGYTSGKDRGGSRGGFVRYTNFAYKCLTCPTYWEEKWRYNPERKEVGHICSY